MLKKLWKEEQGSVVVLAALAMTAMIGMAALVVDVGSMTNERSLLQNAADAAALAAVVEPASNQVQVAKAYVMANTTGVAEEDIIVTQLPGGNVQVDITKDSKAFFSQLLTGSNTNQVSAHAVARLAEQFNASEVALWAENEISFAPNVHIYGSVYSNSNNFSRIDKATIHDGDVLSQGQVMPDYSYLLQAGYSNVIWVDNVKLGACAGKTLGNSTSSTHIVIKKEEDAEDFFKELTNNHTDPSDAIYYFYEYDGTIEFKKAPVNASMIFKNDISFTASGAIADTFIIYSINGDIELSASGHGGVMKTLLYAPAGNVNLQASSYNIQGSIVAQNIAVATNTEVRLDSVGLVDPSIKGRPKLVE